MADPLAILFGLAGLALLSAALCVLAVGSTMAGVYAWKVVSWPFRAHGPGYWRV